MASINGQPLSFEAVIENNDFNRGIADMERRLAGLTQTTNQQASSVESFAKKAAAAAAGYFSLQAATGFVRQMAAVRGEFQQTEIALQSILGNKAEADKLMGQVVDMAAKTPFALKEIAEGSKLLLAYQFGAGEVTDTLTRLGNVASGLNIPFNELVQLYGKTRTEGRLMAEDLNQFTGRGIPMITELAKVMGVAESEVRGLVSAGKIGFPEVQKVMQNLTNEGGMFFNLMEQQSKTITGQLSNLGDAYDRMLNAMGQENEGLMSAGIQGAITLVENYENVVDIIKVLVATYGVYRAALLVNTVAMRAAAVSTGQLTAVQALAQARMMLVARAQAILNATMLANPYVAAATAMAALVSALYLFSSAQDSATEAKKAFNSVREEAAKSVAKEKLQLEELLKVAKDETKSLGERESALKKINQISPEYLGNLDLAKLKTQEGQQALDAYNASLDMAALKQAAFNKKVQLQEVRLEIQSGNDDSIGWWEKAGAFLKGGISGGSVQAEYVKLISDKILELKEQEGAIDEATQKGIEELQAIIDRAKPETAKILTNRQKVDAAESADAVSALIKEFQDAYGAATTDGQRKLLSEDIKYAKAREEQLNKYLDSLKKANKAEQDLRKEQQKFLAQLAKQEQDVRLKGLTEDEREIEQARLKFQAMREEAKKLRLGPGVKVRIDRMEEEETGSILYKQETDRLREDLDKQKALYKEYEEYRLDFGTQKANERFQNELDLSKTFLQRLKEESEKITVLQPEDRTPEQTERLKFLQEQMGQEEKLQQTQYGKLLKGLQAYEGKRTLLIEQYQKDRRALMLAGDVSALEGLDARHQKDLEELDDANAEKLASFKRLFQGVNDLSTQEARKVVTLAQQKLKELVAQGRISKEFAEQIEKLLKSTSSSIDKRLPKQIREMGAELSNLAYAVEGINQGFAQVIGTTGNLLQNLAMAQESALNMKEALGKKDIMGSFSAGFGIVQGVMAAISVAKSIGDSMNAKNAAERQRAADQQQYVFDMQIRQNDAILKQLDRQLSLIREIYGTERITEYQRSLQTIQTQYDKLSDTFYDIKPSLEQDGLYALTGTNKELDKALEEYRNGLRSVYSLNPKGNPWTQAELDKLIPLNQMIADLQDPAKKGSALAELQNLLEKGLLDTTTAAIVEGLVALEEQYKDTLNAIRAELTGTSIEGLVDELAEMFARGERSAEAFGEKFEEIMKRSILNSFKRQALEKELQAFYESFAAASESGGVLTEEEIAKLRNSYETIIAEAAKKFEELQKLTGIGFGGEDTASPNKTGLAGAIRGITEEQADLLAGQFGAVRLHLAELVGMKRQEMGLDKDNSFLLQQSYSMQEMSRLAFQNLQVAQRIEQNTAATVTELVNVVREGQAQNASLRDHTKSLKSIDSKISNTNDILRANGG